MSKNIHIGYGDSATGCLLEAIKSFGLPGNTAIPSRDDFTQGPISESINDLSQRIRYWESVDEVLNFRNDVKAFYLASIKVIDELEADDITIWVGNSCHDILATGWLLSYLRSKKIKWNIINLAFLNEEDLPDGLPPVNLAMYAPQDIVKLYKYRKALTDKEEKYFISIWEKAALENSQYRIQDENGITSVDGDHFDEYILSHIQDKFEVTSKVIERILQDGQHRISDTTVEWNIRKMIQRNQIGFQGDLNSMRSYKIKKII